MTVTRRRPALAGLAAAVALGGAWLVFTNDPAVPAASRADAAPAAGADRAGTAGSRGEAVPLDVFVRRFDGLPSGVPVEVGVPKASAVSGLETVPLTVGEGPRRQQIQVYRSTDGRYLMLGPLLDLSKDPFEPVAARLDLRGRPGLGPADAPVTVVEYSSFQCPYCRKLAPAVKQTMAGPLGRQVRWVYKHFPLSTQAWSEPAAVGAECARRLGGDAGFWALHDLYFAQQDGFTPQNHRERAVAWARSAGLPVRRFERCLDSPEALERVRADAAEGREIGVTQTPTLVFNGRLAPGAVSAEVLAGVLEQELAYRRALVRTAAKP